MPRGDTHDMVEKALTGKITGMSDVIDALHGILHSHHRIFGHDPFQVALLAKMLASDKNSFGDNFKAGIIHLMLDKSWDTIKGAISPQSKAQTKKLPQNGILDLLLKQLNKGDK